MTDLQKRLEAICRLNGYEFAGEHRHCLELGAKVALSESLHIKTLSHQLMCVTQLLKDREREIAEMKMQSEPVHISQINALRRNVLRNCGEQMASILDAVIKARIDAPQAQPAPGGEG